MIGALIAAMQYAVSVEEAQARLIATLGRDLSQSEQIVAELDRRARWYDSIGYCRHPKLAALESLADDAVRGRL